MTLPRLAKGPTRAAVALALADGSIVTLGIPDILAEYDVEIRPSHGR